MDFKITCQAFFVGILAVLLGSCNKCTDEKLVTIDHVLPTELRNAFDSLPLRTVKINSNKGRNDEMNIGRSFNNEGSRWSEEVDTKCKVERGETLASSFGSQLYSMAFFVGLRVDREGKTRLYVNPGELGYEFKRLAVLDPTNLQDNGICTFYYCTFDRSYQLCRIHDEYGTLNPHAEDSLVNGTYRLYPDTMIAGRSVKNCIELTFSDGRVKGPNAIQKVWFNLHQGLIKFVTQSNEEWLVGMD